MILPFVACDSAASCVRLCMAYTSKTDHRVGFCSARTRQHPGGACSACKTSCREGPEYICIQIYQWVYLPCRTSPFDVGRGPNVSQARVGLSRIPHPDDQEPVQHRSVGGCPFDSATIPLDPVYWVGGTRRSPHSASSYPVSHKNTPARWPAKRIQPGQRAHVGKTPDTICGTVPIDRASRVWYRKKKVGYTRDRLARFSGGRAYTASSGVTRGGCTPEAAPPRSHVWQCDSSLARSWRGQHQL